MSRWAILRERERTRVGKFEDVKMMENLGLTLVDRAFLSKALIQLPADGWDCAPSLLVVWPVVTKPLSLRAL